MLLSTFPTPLPKIGLIIPNIPSFGRNKALSTMSFWKNEFREKIHREKILREILGFGISSQRHFQAITHDSGKTYGQAFLAPLRPYPSSANVLIELILKFG